MIMRPCQLVFRMAVNLVRGRMDGRLVESFRANVEDPGLCAVHPNRDVLTHERYLTPDPRRGLDKRQGLGGARGKPYNAEGVPLLRPIHLRH
jgi:hypothetical protein